MEDSHFISESKKKWCIADVHKLSRQSNTLFLKRNWKNLTIVNPEKVLEVRVRSCITRVAPLTETRDCPRLMEVLTLAEAIRRR